MQDDWNHTNFQEGEPVSSTPKPEGPVQQAGVPVTPQAPLAEENIPHQNYGYPYSNVQPNYTVPPQGSAPVPPKKPKMSHKKKGLIIFLSCLGACVVLGLVALVLSFFYGDKISQKPQKPSTPDISVQDAPVAPLETEDGTLTPKGVYEKVKNASVGVLVYKDSSFTNAALAGQGSGVIIGEDDTHTYTYILTCAHVISGGGTVTVQLHDETQYEATVLGYDSRTDIGVLRITAKGLTICEIGDSEQLSVGEPVYAIGNPGGVSFAGSFTDGIVSAIARPVNSEIGYEMLCIQHTAAINPGNSGGALVNSAGQLVGINSSKIAGDGFEGMGFSVPSSTAKEVFDEIVANGYVTNRPKLGIRYFPAAQNQMYGMIAGVNHLPAGTIVIEEVTPDSDLKKKDIQKGDMITKVNGKELETADVLPDAIENANVGDTLKLTICRINMQNNYELQEFDVDVKLIEDRGETAAQNTNQNTEHSFYNPFENFPFGN